MISDKTVMGNEISKLGLVLVFGSNQGNIEIRQHPRQYRNSFHCDVTHSTRNSLVWYQMNDVALKSKQNCRVHYVQNKRTEACSK